jgi:hypothetical protein
MHRGGHSATFANIDAKIVYRKDPANRPDLGSGG